MLFVGANKSENAKAEKQIKFIYPILQELLDECGISSDVKPARPSLCCKQDNTSRRLLRWDGEKSITIWCEKFHSLLFLRKLEQRLKEHPENKALMHFPLCIYEYQKEWSLLGS